MKKIILSFITVMVFAQACSQTEEEMTAAFANDAETVDNPLTPLLDGLSMMDFKEDFIGYRPVKKSKDPSARPFFMKHKHIPYMKDKSSVEAAYPAMKEDMIYYYNQDAVYHAADIQYVALRMLRYHLLPDNSQIAVEETQFLLDLLVKIGAVDLDVLVDAYIKVKPSLTDQQQMDHRDYLQKLYYKDKKYIADNFEVLKNGYETSTGIQKREFLYQGRFMVKKFQALQYANDLLQIETEQKK